MRILIVSLTGIALLISGIFIMRYGLKKMLWGRLQNLLSTITVTPLRGTVVGTIAAAVMQSSTAVSLITIGLVSAEYLTFYQGLGVILGANIGTCSTVQLMTLSLSEEQLIPLFGITLVVAAANKKIRYVALALSGLLSMFLGLSILSNAFNNLSQYSTVVDCLLAAKSNPLYGILGGIIITVLFQSSSAATGVLMMLADEGIVDLVSATYVIYGNNIGSCLSSVIVGAAAPLAAKRVAVSHILLNLIGVVVAMPFTNQLAGLAANITTDFAGQIAWVHTLFNILSSIAILPVIKYYAKLIMIVVPDRR